jgi:uncharacterized protein
MTRRFLFLALVCLAPSVGCASSLRSFEHSLVFQGRPHPSGDWTPDDDLFTAVHFTAKDGVKLHGWYSEHPSPRAVVLFSHGNAGNIAGRRYLLPYFRDDLGCSVLIYDYRGYGKSEGVSTEDGVLLDGRAARDWLANHNDIAPEEVTLVGGSLGGSIAVDMAAKEGARGLVLVSTFTSIPDVAQSHLWWAPIRGLMTVSLHSEAKIADYHGPLLQTHGDADRVVPYALGKRLFAAANEPKQFIATPGGGHSDAPTEEFTRALDQFIEDLPPIRPLSKAYKQNRSLLGADRSESDYDQND